VPSQPDPWVLVPYVDLAPETHAAVERYAPSLTWTGFSDEAYCDALRSAWSSGTDFVLVEQDVVPHPSAIDELWNCPHDWCAFEYRCGSIVTTALGCTKFSTALRARNTDVISRIQNRRWQDLDSQIIGTLHSHGEAEHVHQPPVRHLKYDRDPLPALVTATPRRAERSMRLLYVGGGRYLNAIPAADFDTLDPETIAVCLESGLYIDAGSPELTEPRRWKYSQGGWDLPVAPAPEPDVTPEPETPAVVEETEPDVPVTDAEQA